MKWHEKRKEVATFIGVIVLIGLQGRDWVNLVDFGPLLELQADWYSN